MLNLQEMKNKLVKVALIVFFAGLTLGFFTGAVTEYSLTKNKIVEEVYTVKKGDTLMDICIEYRKRDCRNPYILEYMDEIRRINPDINSNLKVGDEIKIQYKERKND